MKHETIDVANSRAVDGLSDSCSNVAVGCADVAGLIKTVIASSEKLRAEHDALMGTVEALDQDQGRVAEASEEARLISKHAIDRLNQGTEHIRSSLSQIGQLLSLVDTLSRHVTGFAAAMEQVRKSSHDIEQLAQTTNILSLNAAIEAARAGEAGKSFAVVASEVKILANKTRVATDEISRTIDALGGEAEQVIEQIESSEEVSQKARSSVARIEETLTGVIDMVNEVDKQNEQITRSTGTISEHVGCLHDVLHAFNHAAIDNENKLSESHRRMVELEETSNLMFDSIVHAGLCPRDEEIVNLALRTAEEVKELAIKAMEAGELDESALFDDNYIEVAGTNPKLYRSRLSDWADKNWRPILDRIQASNRAVVATVCDDRNGFLPTHLSDRSKKPTGDYNHDLPYCRNGRIIFNDADRRLKKATADYSLAVYRYEADGKNYRVVRLVSVPMVIRGRRWGEYEITYAL
jgi:methyl-accepting chemotaxis protein